MCVKQVGRLTVLVNADLATVIYKVVYPQQPVLNIEATFKRQEIAFTLCTMCRKMLEGALKCQNIYIFKDSE